MYYRILPTHAIPIVRITHIRQILSSANHPDDWLTVARWLTFCLSEYYDKKNRWSDIFFANLGYPENQAIFTTFTHIYHQKLIPPTGIIYKK